jgi:hypothetical protein
MRTHTCRHIRTCSLHQLRAIFIHVTFYKISLLVRSMHAYTHMQTHTHMQPGSIESNFLDVKFYEVSLLVRSMHAYTCKHMHTCSLDQLRAILWMGNFTKFRYWAQRLCRRRLRYICVFMCVSICVRMYVLFFSLMRAENSIKFHYRAEKRCRRRLRCVCMCVCVCVCVCPYMDMYV